MSTVTLRTGALVIKDPADIKTYVVDWDTENLAEAVTISTSTWTVTPISPSIVDAALTKDSEIKLTGDRKTQIRLTGGTLGQTYEVANKIVTSETPAQTKERSFRVLIQNL